MLIVVCVAGLCVFLFLGLAFLNVISGAFSSTRGIQQSYSSDLPFVGNESPSPLKSLIDGWERYEISLTGLKIDLPNEIEPNYQAYSRNEYYSCEGYFDYVCFAKDLEVNVYGLKLADNEPFDLEEMVNRFREGYEQDLWYGDVRFTVSETKLSNLPARLLLGDKPKRGLRNFVACAMAFKKPFEIYIVVTALSKEETSRVMERILRSAAR